MEFDEKHGEFGTWHCVVGRKFGCFVTHGKGLFVYFYIGQLGICLFATIQ
jgi:dynein light chain LC8-type